LTNRSVLGNPILLAFSIIVCLGEGERDESIANKRERHHKKATHSVESVEHVCVFTLV
jgi:hypothetical protein